MGVIDEQAIEDLNLVVNLAQHIHVRTKKSGAPETKASELADYFPSFLWVLRDFHLQLVDESGSKITERDYLENALRPLSGQNDKNKIRDAIKDFFRDRDCMTLVRPCAEEADLRNIERMPYESLRPQFRTQVESFVERVYRSLKPKKIGPAGYVNGQMLVNLCSEYCKAINCSAVPVIQSAWQSVVHHQLSLCLKDAVTLYRGGMNDKAMIKLPLSEEQLREVHKESKAAALEVLLGARFDANSEQFKRCKAEFSTRIKQLSEHAKAENLAASERQCQKVASELYREHVAGKLSDKDYTSFDELKKDWEFVRCEYMHTTAGPAQLRILSEFLTSRMSESMQTVWLDMKPTAKPKAKPISSDTPNTPSELEDFKDARRRWLNEKSELTEELRRTKEHLEEANRERYKLKDEKLDLLESDRMLREQVQRLTEKLVPAASRPVGWGRSCT